MAERWLPVVGYEGAYSVSDHGRVRSEHRVITRTDGQTATIAARILKPSPKGDSANHLVVTLHDVAAVRRRVADIAHLVLDSFVGPCPPGLQCCHANDIGTDNQLANLRWDTPSANKHDLVRNGRHAMASKTACKSGHDFTPDNTRITRHGARECRKCQSRWQQEHRDRNKEGRAAA